MHGVVVKDKVAEKRAILKGPRTMEIDASHPLSDGEQPDWYDPRRNHEEGSHFFIMGRRKEKGGGSVFIPAPHKVFSENIL